jgi:uncharacterized repeat protein (TIGR01451 family)
MSIAYDSTQSYQLTADMAAVLLTPVLTATKTGPATATAGVTNTGFGLATNVVPSDVNTNLSGITLAPTSVASLLPGASTVFTVSASPLLTFTGNLMNTGTVLCDQLVSATATTPAATVVSPPTVDVIVTKSGPVGNVTCGTVTTTTTVRNAGPADIVSTFPVVFTEPLPTGVTTRTWTRILSGGASNSLGATGTGAITDNLTLPVNAQVTYTIIDLLPIGYHLF